MTFNGTSTKDCTIDNVGTWSQGTFTIASGYTGTITLGTNISVGDWSQADGTVNAGSYTIYAYGSSWSNSGGTFNAGTGTLYFNRNDNQTWTPGSVSYYDVVINMTNGDGSYDNLTVSAYSTHNASLIM